jgi:hypothetical protein
MRMYASRCAQLIWPEDILINFFIPNANGWSRDKQENRIFFEDPWDEEALSFIRRKYSSKNLKSSFFIIFFQSSPH